MVQKGDGAMTSKHEHWSSRAGFLLAAIGAAVGLGSVWKFPYTVGANGGGAFVLIYLLATLLITLPILIAELAIGRRGQASPPNACQRVAAAAGRSSAWVGLGWLSMIAVFMIMTFYSVIGGWVLAYVVKAASGAFQGLDAAAVDALFKDLLASPVEMAIWHGVFMALSALVLLGGIQHGIERLVKIAMPALFVMLLGLVIYAAMVGDVGGAARFLFAPKFSAVTAQTVLSAIGLSFFTIGTGMALMMTYGSYLGQNEVLSKSALIITLSVPVAALCTGMAVFPLVLANGLNPGEGPGLLFVTLPLAFGQMPGGQIVGFVFFVLVFLAAITSAIAGIQPMVAWGEEHRGIDRRLSTVTVAAVGWLLGLGTVLSFNLWADFHPLAGWGKYGAMTLFELIDFLTSNVLLPLANILICLFVGWALPRAVAEQEAGLGGGALFYAWRLTLRFLAPLAIAILLVQGV